MRAGALVAAGIALAAVSCGGDGVIDLGTGPPPGVGPTLAAIQTSIFTPQCAFAGCHAGPGAQQGLDLSAGTTYAHTVGVASVELITFDRVAPGNAADSYLYMKIAGDPRIIGDRMPLGGTLTADQIDAVRAWIDAGARND